MEKKIIEIFRDYYSRFEFDSQYVEDLERREIAIWPFNSTTLIRHLSFSNFKDFKQFILKNVPMHVYNSVAKYQNPSIPNMESKSLIEAEVVFDIDIDHVNTSCKLEHDIWICKSCNKTGKGFVAECDNCGSLTIDKKSFVCNNCLDVAKDEVLKLIEDFLFSDFGLSKDDIKILFSGNRGYHVHIINKSFSSLDSRARNMLVDYVKGISARMYLKEMLKKKKFKFKGINSNGFFGRFAECIYDKINNRTYQDWEKFGLSSEKIEQIKKLKDVFLQELKQYDCDYSFLNVLGNYKERFIDGCIREISVDIDERVTVDIHRLIRFPNSIHGKTGLKVVPIKYEDIYKFEPFRDALIFLKGEARISFKVKRNFPKIYMNDEEFDLNSVENKDIPLYLALYLYLGGYANIINFSI